MTLWPKWGSTLVGSALVCFDEFVAFASWHSCRGSEDTDESAREKSEERGSREKKLCRRRRERDTSLTGHSPRPWGPTRLRLASRHYTIAKAVARPFFDHGCHLGTDLGAPATVQDLHGEGLERSMRLALGEKSVQYLFRWVDSYKANHIKRIRVECW